MTCSKHGEKLIMCAKFNWFWFISHWLKNGREIFKPRPTEGSNNCCNCVPYLPVYKSTFYNLKISPKNRPRLIHGSKTEIKKSSGQLSIIIVSYGNKHPLLHSATYDVFSLINFSSSS